MSFSMKIILFRYDVVFPRYLSVTMIAAIPGRVPPRWIVD
jgi:hypothetical protein